MTASNRSGNVAVSSARRASRARPGGGIWLIMLAALLAAGGGCNDDKAKQQADEQLANVRRERDDYLAQRDRAREELKRAREALAEKYGNALAEAERRRQEVDRQLDEIRDAVNAAMAADGRIAPLADGDRTNVAKLTRELIRRFDQLAAQVKDLQAECELLTQARDSLTRSLQKQADSPPASRPEGGGL